MIRACYDKQIMNNNEFIPVRPIPPEGYPNIFKILRMVRKDLLSIWPEGAYHTDFFGRKIFNRWLFIANNPATVEHVFVKKNDVYQRKSPFMRKALEPLLGDGLFVSDGDTWKKRRSIEAPAFVPSKLKIFSSVMTECAGEWRDRWHAQYLNREIRILPEMASLTAEILARTMFGNKLGHENAEKIISGFSEYQACIEQIDLVSFFGLPEWMPRLPQWRRAIRMAENIHSVVDDLIAKHLAGPENTSTLLGMLLKGYEPGKPGSMTLEQVRNEAVVILMAGHETTANSLAWTWYLLARHPRAATRLREELHRVLAGRPPTFEDVPALVYTRAVFEEALRLYPPVPVLSREAVDEDEIQGHRIPRGTIMLVMPWLLHRRSEYWDKPHHFIPERFTPERVKRHHKYAYIPFSVGPRICLGAAFGMTEAVLCLATLAQQFSLEIKPGHIPGYDCRLTLRPSGGLPMILKMAG